MLTILLSNDDGVYAEGIRMLAKALQSFGRVILVAPDRNRSGASNSLTLSHPLRIRELKPDVISVEGTPTDCVHLAVTGLLDEKPDIIISGINEGANLSDDVWYSGTVAAAMEGRFLGIPSLAVSLVSDESRNYHYETAAQVVVNLMDSVLSKTLPHRTFLNVNIPDVPYEQLKGYEVTTLGKRHSAQPTIRATDPRGKDIYWVGPVGEASDDRPGTDFHAVNQNKVSLTPLKIDLTDHEMFDQLQSWVKDIDS